MLDARSGNSTQRLTFVKEEERETKHFVCERDERDKKHRRVSGDKRSCTEESRAGTETASDEMVSDETAFQKNGRSEK